MTLRWCQAGVDPREGVAVVRLPVGRRDQLRLAVADLRDALAVRVPAGDAEALAEAIVARSSRLGSANCLAY
jgi:hypothetical protein